MRNYLNDILSFEEWTKQNSLKPTAQCLYYKLLHINYECSWKEWFTVWNDTLLKHLNVTDKTLYDAREVLIGIKLIEYKPDRSKRKPGIYKTNSLSQLINGEIPSTSGEIPLIEPPISGIFPLENPINGKIPPINGKIPPINGNFPPFLVDKVVNVDKVEKGNLEESSNDKLFDQILDYYKEKTQRAMESVKDIELVQRLIGMPGMTFEYCKEGIDESLGNYVPHYQGQRMPLAYCKPAIYRIYNKATKPKCAIPFVPKNQQHTIPQAENFKQRKYDDEFFENLYEEV